ncbi:hypothetical protein PPYR_01403 [Photinus pyralis]|uniref:Uncharacterized protein n=1 Tax=Photinus pyralis TaxID=7054 RepID=A0A5N4B4F5_PHOPY|nr:uncharacterized protein LOC116160153 [Photinus pyralis]XP_031335281.1 uncharacterized protein LOC116165124 [Photinus pyralis]KAB0804433.1 hypothetical protein PPYR_01403 [Photinus pyralis]
MDRFCSYCGARRQLEFDRPLDRCSKCDKFPFILSHEVKSASVLRCSVCTAYICAINRYCEICGHTVENSKRIRGERAGQMQMAGKIQAKKMEAIERRKRRKLEAECSSFSASTPSTMTSLSPSKKSSSNPLSFSSNDDEDVDNLLSQIPDSELSQIQDSQKPDSELSQIQDSEANPE